MAAGVETSELETLLVRRTDVGALSVTLNRPVRRNALNAKMLDELWHVFLGLSANPEGTRVVLLRGAGDHFCAGLDQEGGEIDSARLYELVAMVYDSALPTVVALHGRVSGFGFAVAVAADVRIAAASMQADDVFVRLGVSGCELGISYLLPRQVSASIAAELVHTGRVLDADRAARIGWVSDVVADSALDREAERLVDDMLRAAPLALQTTKQVLRAGSSAADLRAAMAVERAAQAACMTGPDFKEAIDAFVERRAPAWSENGER